MNCDLKIKKMAPVASTGWRTAQCISRRLEWFETDWICETYVSEAWICVGSLHKILKLKCSCVLRNLPLDMNKTLYRSTCCIHAWVDPVIAANPVPNPHLTRVTQPHSTVLSIFHCCGLNMANFKANAYKRRRTATGPPQAQIAKFLETISKLPGATSPPDRHDDHDLSQALSRALSLEPARGTLASMFAPVRDTLTRHEQAFYDLRLENYNLRQELHELKQYTRRNALRVYNANWVESKDEDTDKRIIDLAREFGIAIQNFEISRSHRVGRPEPGKIRPILVKFIGYRPRERLYNARKDIKAKYPTIDIFEDLTATTAQLSYNARQLRRAGEIQQTWVRDGKVFVVLNHGGRAHLIHDEDELRHLVSQRHPEGAYGPPQATHSPHARPPPRQRPQNETMSQSLGQQPAADEQRQAVASHSSASAEATNMPQSPLTALSDITQRKSEGVGSVRNRRKGSLCKTPQHSGAPRSDSVASEATPARSSPRASGRRHALSLASQFKKLVNTPPASTPSPGSPSSANHAGPGLRKITQYTTNLSTPPQPSRPHSVLTIPEITLEPPTPSRITDENTATSGLIEDPQSASNDSDLNSSSSDIDISVDDEELAD